MLRRFAMPMLGLPRFAKRAMVLALDSSLCVLTVWLAYYLRLGELLPLEGPALWAVGTSIAVALPIFILVGLYRAIFRFSGWPALMTVTKAVVFLRGYFCCCIYCSGGARCPSHNWAHTTHTASFVRWCFPCPCTDLAERPVPEHPQEGCAP